MMGLINGTPVNVATRRSVILKSDGLEFLLTFCVAASTSSLPFQELARLSPAVAAPADLKKIRRLQSRFKLDFMGMMRLPSSEKSQRSGVRIERTPPS